MGGLSPEPGILERTHHQREINFSHEQTALFFTGLLFLFFLYGGLVFGVWGKGFLAIVLV